MERLLEFTEQGLYCRQGDFYVDPRRPVPRAIVSHAHSDHARWGCRRYLASFDSRLILKQRLAPDADVQCLAYGETLTLGGVQISLHPAGHILGSAQVRLEHRGRVEVVTGDYKLEPDATCAPWEPLDCHLLITESTFGLPVYRWQPQVEVFQQINDWWREAREAGRCCILYGYAVGKSQRLLAGLDPQLGPIFTHGAVEKGNAAYRDSGVALPPTTHVGGIVGKRDWGGAMVVAVPSAHGTSWLKRFGNVSTAMASGWMAVRGNRRRRAVDRGFVLSDHVDWPSLLAAVEACDPEEVWVTHGYAATVARYLRECGREALVLESGPRMDEDEELEAGDNELTPDKGPDASDEPHG